MAKPYQGTVYIAGPMRGIRDNNWPAFDGAAVRFRNKVEGRTMPIQWNGESPVGSNNGQ